MERRNNANTMIIAVLAIAVGFLAALLIFRGSSSDNSSATVGTTAATTTTATGAPPAQTAATTTTTTATATTPGSVPTSPQATVSSCIDLWNQQNNRGDQTFLVNLFSRQPIRVHVGTTSDVPPKCLITVVANNGDAYVFPEGGGSTYPYAQAPGATSGSSLPAAQKISNALEQSDGTLKAR